MPYKDRDAQRAYLSDHYRRNKTRYGMSQKINRIRAKLMVYQYLKAHPCVNCGEADPTVLEFHHRDPASKDAPITALVRNGFARVAREIEKCDVLCANCHRRFHHAARFANLERLLVEGLIKPRAA